MGFFFLIFEQKLKVWSDSATASSTVQGDKLDIHITDPELKNGEDTGERNGESEIATLTTAEQSDGVPSDSGEGKITTELKESTEAESTPSAGTVREDTTSVSAAAESSAETKAQTVSSPEIDSVPSVKVEADGSVFIRGNSDYIKNRDSVVAALKEEEADTAQGPSTARSKVKLSNKLLYSLD